MTLHTFPAAVRVYLKKKKGRSFLIGRPGSSTKLAVFTQRIPTAQPLNATIINCHNPNKHDKHSSSFSPLPSATDVCWLFFFAERCDFLQPRCRATRNLLLLPPPLLQAEIKDPIYPLILAAATKYISLISNSFLHRSTELRGRKHRDKTRCSYCRAETADFYGELCLRYGRCSQLHPLQ